MATKGTHLIIPFFGEISIFLWKRTSSIIVMIPLCASDIRRRRRHCLPLSLILSHRGINFCSCLTRHKKTPQLANLLGSLHYLFPVVGRMLMIVMWHEKISSLLICSIIFYHVVPECRHPSQLTLARVHLGQVGNSSQDYQEGTHVNTWRTC